MMFDVKKIYTNISGTRFLCDCFCASEKQAQYVAASFLMSVREYDFLANLYSKGNKVVIDTPSKDKTAELCLLLNNSISTLNIGV